MTGSAKSRFSARIVTISSRAAAGAMVDESGPLIAERLARTGLDVTGIDLIPDERLAIQKAVIRSCDFEPVSLLVLTGGTGPDPDDVTPDALAPLLDRHYDGIVAAIQSDGRRQTPRAPLSRTVIGARGRTVLVALPGSPAGVRDAITTLEPVLSHLLALTAGLADPH